MNSLWIWQSCGCVYPADTSLQNELCPLLSVVMADNDSVPRRSYQRVLEHKAVCELAYCLRLLPTAPSHPHPLPPPCSVPQCVWLVAQTPSIRIALQCSNEEGGGEEGKSTYQQSLPIVALFYEHTKKLLPSIFWLQIQLFATCCFTKRAAQVSICL